MPFKTPNFTGFGAKTITVGTIESQDATSVQIDLGDDAGDDFIVDTNKLVVEGDSGRVGIGTDSPEKTLSVDGDMHFQPTTISTAHVTTAGSLDIRATENIRIGTDGADSIRIGRENSSACKVHIRSGSNTDLVVTDGKVGIGMEDPTEALEVDGDIQLTPTATSTAHLKTTGSLDVRASGNIKIGTDGSDSIRLGRINSTACKVHIRSGADTNLVISDNKVGIGTDSPSQLIHASGSDPIFVIQSSDNEHGEGQANSKILFGDHAGNALAMLEGAHSGSNDDSKGKFTISTDNGSGSQLAMSIDDAQITTFSANVVVGGTTPKLTIGDAGTEDTMLVFDGNAVDFRVGIDDGTDTLEIGKGTAHGTTPVIKIDSNTNCQVMHNSAVADGEYSGDLAMFTAGEDLTAGEVVYAKSDGKMWKAVATAEATARCVAMSVATTSADASGPFLLKGFARFNSEFPTYTVGGALYTPEAETSGKNVPEQAAPDTDGDFVQVIGWAVSADSVYFDPDSTVIEVA